MFIFRYQSTESFYSTAKRWWKDWNFNIIAEEALPKNVAVCYLNDGTPIYAVFVYFTDSSLVWLGFPVSNKNIAWKDKKGGLTYLIQELTNYLSANGVRMVITTTSSNSFSQSLEANGYVVGDSDVKHYIKTL